LADLDGRTLLHFESAVNNRQTVIETLAVGSPDQDLSRDSLATNIDVSTAAETNAETNANREIILATAIHLCYIDP